MKWYAIILGLAIVLLAVCFARRCPTPRSQYVAGYTGSVSDGQRVIVKALVENVAPMMKGLTYDKYTIDRSLDRMGLLTLRERWFDQPLYFAFRRQLETGTLSTQHLLDAIRYGPLI
jgi:hypothetical protein